jgi:hypothetical protein
MTINFLSGIDTWHRLCRGTGSRGRTHEIIRQPLTHCRRCIEPANKRSYHVLLTRDPGINVYGLIGSGGWRGRYYGPVIMIGIER